MRRSALGIPSASTQSARRIGLAMRSKTALQGIGISLFCALGGAFALLLSTAVLLAFKAEVLPSVNAVPPHVAGTFSTPLAYQMLLDGTSYVFDRRQHTVYRLDAARTKATPLVMIGAEQGRLLQPTAFESMPTGNFVVADAPRNKERIQVFQSDGQRISGFELTGGALARVTIDNVVLNGIGSLCFTGETILLNRPETGGLITEYDIYGKALRTIGFLRATGQEADPALHLAFNSGVPLAIPRGLGGGFYVVFLSGEPLFQRYDDKGTLLYSRRIQGRELDRLIAQQPTRWPRRTIAGNEIPMVAPIVRTARVDPSGQLWVSLVVPYTYVYDLDGDKIGSVQFRAAGMISPTSLSFGTDWRVFVTPGLYEFHMGPLAK
jgi:hypothetical protein